MGHFTKITRLKMTHFQSDETLQSVLIHMPLMPLDTNFYH